MIVPVILCGGSGRRLWPLSTPEKPKQFLALVSERSLFQETLLRLEGLPDVGDPIVVCNEAHRDLAADQLAEIGVRARAIVLEPEGRNTAPAIAVAANLGSANPGSDPKPILLVLPADHVIADGEAFRAAVADAVLAAKAGKLVSFGVVPTSPETGYGYVERGADEGAWSTVARFVEKPDLATAERYLESGRFLWNSGMFVFSAAVVLGELQRLAPAIHSACEAAVAGSAADGAFTKLGPEFLASPSVSIDYAVMEKTDRAAVVPLDAGWNDVGSWAALHDALDKDADGNVLRGETLAHDAKNCLVISDLRKIALLGLKDIIVIDTGSQLLIVKKEHAQRVKHLVESLEEDAKQK